MKVTLSKTSLLISLDYYSPQVIAVLGLFSGRKYNVKTKVWAVPHIHVQKLVDVLGPFGFHFSDGVVDMYKTTIIKIKKTTRIKTEGLNSTEQHAVNNLELPLYIYQQKGAGFLATSTSALIGDQPGTGKTIQTVSMTRLKNAKKVLIFCPVSMKQTWFEEIAKWSPGSTAVIVGGTPTQRLEQWAQDVTYYICNYHLLLRDLDSMQLKQWDYILADEATSLANPKSKTVHNLKKIKSVGKIAMTGTPLSNKVEDVWSIFDWTHPGLLGSYWQFLDEYCTKDKFGSVTGYKNLQKLQQILEPYMIRRLKRDVLTELPPKLYNNIYVDFTPDEQKLYNAIVDECMLELKESGMMNQNNLSQAIVKLVRLSQMADSAELITGERVSSKCDALKELLEVALANGEKALIFTQFKEMALILERELAQYKPLMIAGGVSAEDRDKNRVMFQEDDEHKILIMTSAGSMGLNLQRASVVVHYDMPWSIAMTEQREDRAHRNGQLGNVTVYRMLVRDSIDEYKLKVLHKKKDTSDIVLGDSDVDEIRKTGLTKTDLRNILTSVQR